MMSIFDKFKKPVFSKRALFDTALAMMLAFLAFTIYSRYIPFSFVWNRTPSIPMGLYFAKERQGEAIERGQLACFAFKTPDWAQGRKYFPDGAKLCKPVVGMPGDTIVREGNEIQVRTPGGRVLTAGKLAATDSKGRPLPQDVLTPGQTIPFGMYLLAAPRHATSSDSRYLGLISLDRLSHRVWPLITY